jgi:hypothetical protein
MPLATFTTVHVVISIVALLSGFIIAAGMLTGKRLPGWTALFLVTTILTSATGFLFPSTQLIPSHILGIISLAVLALAVIALYGFRLGRSWRWIYAITAIAALYFNAFVAVVQAFQKFAALKALAPTQSEPPFVAAQLVVLAGFFVLAFLAIRKFHPSVAAA